MKPACPSGPRPSSESEIRGPRGARYAAIALALGIRQRRLYTRRESSLRTLRRSLERRGLDAAEVLAALEWSDDEGEFDVQGPSKQTEPKGSSSK